jgi:hypothetical protein
MLNGDVKLFPQGDSYKIGKRTVHLNLINFCFKRLFVSYYINESGSKILKPFSGTDEFKYMQILQRVP